MGKSHLTRYLIIIIDCYRKKPNPHSLFVVCLFAGNGDWEAREAHRSNSGEIQCDMGVGAGEEQCTRVL